jgi:hypothetical protein
VFRIGGNTFYNRKNKIPMKIPEFKRSGIGLIPEFHRIPNGFPNQALVAAGWGGGTSETAANSSTCAPRRWGAAKQAPTRREDRALLQSFQSGGPLGQSMCAREGNLAKLYYMQNKQLIDRKIVENKRGVLTQRKI